MGGDECDRRYCSSHNLNGLSARRQGKTKWVKILWGYKMYILSIYEGLLDFLHDVKHNNAKLTGLPLLQWHAENSHPSFSLAVQTRLSGHV